MSDFPDGLYWVRVSTDLEPEIAMRDHGAWRVIGSLEPLETADFFRVGRRVEVQPDSFD
ncbi:MAG TPA: hypothetical protein VGU69_10545 [Rhizomicrobium sp.]|nr:hypothetical protein [Rhizomicrobium sp.]